jgi:hypothetical protein
VKDFAELPSDSGREFRTVYIDSIGVAVEEGNQIGILVRPMDESPFVIQVGNLEEFRSLASYLLRVVED